MASDLRHTSMLISVHVPKCAGTSFRHILHEIYGERLWLNYGAIFSRDQARVGIVPATTICIHGHFLADALDDIFPERRLITWVRHPVERVVSNYYHFLRSPDMRDDCCRALIENQLSLVEFAQLDWMQNETSRYLANKPLDAFAFVGIAERFNESLAVFERMFAPHLRLAEKRDNVNPGRVADRYAIMPADYERLEAINAQDMAMYTQAISRLDEMVRDLAPCAA